MPKIRRRYYLWLIKAYVKRWKRTIFTAVLIGIVVSVAFLGFLNFYLRPLFARNVQKIGYWGVYELSDLPPQILSDVSFGLTKVDDSGAVKPGAASSWEIKNDGKTYIFHLKKGLEFHDGKKLNADSVSLNFRDVKKNKIDDSTVSYTLKNPYTPFLTSVSSPIFGKNSSGLGEYKLSDIEINGGFVKSITLQNINDTRNKKHVYFYPTEDALKLAFVMGEVDIISGIGHSKILKSDFAQWDSVKVGTKTDYGSIITLFYNTQDPVLSEKKIRQALSYSLPQKFDDGVKSYSPIPPKSPFYNVTSETQPAGIDLSKTILESPDIKIEQDIIISTTPEFEPLAKTIQGAWEKIGIDSKIQVINSVPDTFQVLLYRFRVPQDPDQYTLWHSTGANNISKYKNLRIDKLLEDGRSTTDFEKRKNLYDDFQKYLLDDVPASFLYFPYQYTVERK